MRLENVVKMSNFNKRERTFASLMLFLIGAFSMTQIRVGFSIGISEIFVYISAPFLFLRNFALLKRHGMLPIIYMGLAVSFACVASGIYNHTPTFFIFKGLASTYPLFAFVVVLHHLLNKNMNGHRWLYFGAACSMIINIFVFQTSFELDTYAGGVTNDAATAIMGGPIFWIGRLKRFIELPYVGWYFQTPLGYSLLAPIVLAVFSMMTSESGRAAALGALGGFFIVLICRKRRDRMEGFCRNFWGYFCVGMVLIVVATAAYKYAGEHGLLNEKATAKYEKQARGGGVLKLLMSGRSEVFIGAMAALDKPLIGHGPWAFDDGRYRQAFLEEYGDEEDYQFFLGAMQHRSREGISYVNFIPAHSHIVSFWLWFGVIGLAYWLYVFYSIFRFLRKEITAVPQWFGILAMGAPSMLWSLFFSGFGYRISTMPFVVLLMMAHNVYKGRIQLPYYMVEEAYRQEHRR